MGDLTVGLTLGKFAPLHGGHQLVIEQALTEMNHVIAVVYGAESVTEVPLAVRAGWIRELYPSVEVIEAPDGPQETGYTPSVMRAQEQFLRNILNGRRVSAFYSSEPYGKHVSRALGCRNRTVDADRRQVPVSARQIRADIPAFAHALDPVVRADVLPCVVTLGGPSTGKSTLATDLGRALGEPVCPEYGREYWFAHQENHRLSMRDLEIIAVEQDRRERQTAREARRCVIADTSPLTTIVYARYYHGRPSGALERIIAGYHHRPRTLLLCDTDIPFDDTSDRSGPGSRDELQRLTLAELSARALPFTIISGDRATRLARACEIAGALRGRV